MTWVLVRPTWSFLLLARFVFHMKNTFSREKEQPRWGKQFFICHREEDNKKKQKRRFNLQTLVDFFSFHLNQSFIPLSGKLLLVGAIRLSFLWVDDYLLTFSFILATINCVKVIHSALPHHIIVRFTRALVYHGSRDVWRKYLSVLLFSSFERMCFRFWTWNSICVRA